MNAMQLTLSVLLLCVSAGVSRALGRCARACLSIQRGGTGIATRVSISSSMVAVAAFQAAFVQRAQSLSTTWRWVSISIYRCFCASLCGWRTLDGGLLPAHALFRRVLLLLRVRTDEVAEVGGNRRDVFRYLRGVGRLNEGE